MCLYLVHTSVRCRVRGYDRELGTACFLFRVVVEYTLDGFSLSAPPHIRIRTPSTPKTGFPAIISFRVRRINAYRVVYILYYVY